MSVGAKSQPVTSQRPGAVFGAARRHCLLTVLAGNQAACLACPPEPAGPRVARVSGIAPPWLSQSCVDRARDLVTSLTYETPSEEIPRRRVCVTARLAAACVCRDADCPALAASAESCQEDYQPGERGEPKCLKRCQ
ncbi:hypothetical protein E2C01_039081 [Portunus trituberculatus]|uniref:Uncharacterized protein n=1 Tax=Portunus trituberculatus TaxID=210409 RepID=A0A5B7FJR5_PORTR|nr:hypothetical protein [Portunus trituberculatus]